MSLSWQKRRVNVRNLYFEILPGFSYSSWRCSCCMASLQLLLDWNGSCLYIKHPTTWLSRYPGTRVASLQFLSSWHPPKTPIPIKSVSAPRPSKDELKKLQKFTNTSQKHCNVTSTTAQEVNRLNADYRYLSSSKVEEYFYLAKMHIYMHLWVFLFFSKNVQLIYVMLCTIYLRQQLLHQFG